MAKSSGKKKKPGQLSSGNFRKQLVIGYDVNGKRIVKSFTARTAWEAEKMAAEYRAKHGVGVAPDELTVSAALEKYINARRDIIAPSTLKGYNVILNHRLQSIMMTKISKLKILDVQAAVNKDHAEKGSSRKTLRSAVSLVNSALVAQGFDYNLLKRITLPGERATKPELPSAETVIEAIKGTEYELPCLLAMWLSMRVSEVRGLKYSDISRDHRHITVCRTRVYLGKGRDKAKGRTKNTGSNRSVWLPEFLYNKIMEQPHSSDDEFIINKTYNQVAQNFHRYMERRGIKITFHQLRHLFATTANDLGVSDDYIQKMGGWSSNSILKSIYTHTTAAMEDRYQRVIDDYYMGVINDCNNKNNMDD
ncbi:Phage integrase family protein [Ruminococcus sp. YE71]|uniref:site-specific integrase n=1 Tax=unclassified Ruminococcus TaxID=2608920 RepID=UPI000880111E|nr:MULTISPECIES: site-specific integrase [unclassified Ruminococcus]SDA11578.1 Phage integrase family protein [Ruminococcus sp. YE78]SFW15457.1 Phage integrase family protein [Ruminococcus sp. YE71]